MPSIHIPEDTWTELLLQHDGDRDAAREAVKEGAARMTTDADKEDYE